MIGIAILIGTVVLFLLLLAIGGIISFYTGIKEDDFEAIFWGLFIPPLSIGMALLILGI